MKAASFLAPNLRNFTSIDSTGASGGLVSAWDQSHFSLVASTPSRCILSLDPSLNDDDSLIRFTNVYAPCDHVEKQLFLQDLGTHAPFVSTPWLIAGDFNLTRDPFDRNNCNFSQQDADLFNDSINALG
jgi:hypothetical protein